MIVELVEGLHISMSSFTYGCGVLSKGCILIFQVSPMVVELVEGLHINMSSFTNGCGLVKGLHINILSFT